MKELEPYLDKYCESIGTPPRKGWPVRTKQLLTELILIEEFRIPPPRRIHSPAPFTLDIFSMAAHIGRLDDIAATAQAYNRLFVHIPWKTEPIAVELLAAYNDGMNHLVLNGVLSDFGASRRLERATNQRWSMWQTGRYQR